MCKGVCMIARVIFEQNKVGLGVGSDKLATCLFPDQGRPSQGYDRVCMYQRHRYHNNMR